jgi:hypothetical protein
VSARFQSAYHIPLRESLTSMPGADLVNLVLQLDKTWGLHEENTALLLETLTAQVEWAWADRTIDPEDPEVKLERAKAKTNGVKPPKHPILRPVAKRPPDHDEQRWRDYITTLSEFVPQPKDPFEQLEIWKRQNGVTASPER